MAPAAPLLSRQRWPLRPSDVSAWLDRQNKLAVAVAATAVHALLYGLPNHIHLAAPMELPMTWVDRAVPFVPQTLWLYWSDYLLVFVAFQLCRRPGSTARFVAAFLTTVLAASVVHWAWPTAYPRGLFPPPADALPLTRSMVDRFRALDTPASCMPSLHVAVAFVSALAVVSEGDRRARWLLAWAGLVWASTLTTKQHYVVDGVGGLLLAVAVWALFYARAQGEAPARPG